MAAFSEQDLAGILEDSKSNKGARRTVLTTRRINVQKLSDDAKYILQAFSMFGNVQIDELLSKAVIENIDTNSKLVKQRFMNVVKSELSSGTSVLERIFVQQEERYEIHRIVRMFIHTDIGLDSALWNKTVHTSIKSIHRTLNFHPKRTTLWI